MCILGRFWRRAGIAAGLLAMAVLAGCDLPSTGPSLQTETGIKTPVVANETFVVLGGPSSQWTPLIDTTTSQFDSLFTVGASDAALSIEEQVSSFEVGSLDAALDEATAGLGVDTSFSETVLQGSGLATQTVSAGPFRERNGIPPPTSPQEATVPVPRDTIPFPPALFSIPNFRVAAIQADTLRQGTLTGETTYQGTSVNRLTLTLYNDPAVAAPLTDGSGGAPTITIRDQSGRAVAEASFGGPIGAGDARTRQVTVAGETLGDDSALILEVEGNGPRDELTVEVSSLRYRTATLAGVEQAAATATRTNVSTREAAGSQVAGIEARSGTMELAVTNNLSFPVVLDTLQAQNNLQQASALPDSFQALDVLRSSGAIAPGATQTFAVDLADRGIARSIDVRVRARLADERDVLAVTADGNLEVSANGPLTVGALYFWPDGEQVQSGGQLSVQQDRLRFERAGDYVELSGGTLVFDQVVSQPQVGFESIAFSFPDLRRSPYGAGDSLTVSTAVEAERSPSIDDVDLSDLRLSPTDNVLDYHLTGTLESIAPAQQTADNLRVLRSDDAIRAEVSAEGLKVRALEAAVSPFTVNVTPDANGDGRLSLSNPAEVTQASFDGFGEIAQNVDEVGLEGSTLKFRLTTDVGTEADLYAALQGRTENARTYLSGNAENTVSPSAPLGDAFYEDGSRVPRSELLRVGVEGAPTDDPHTESITLTDENSTIDAFVSALPSALRFAAQARLTGTDDGRIRLRRPITFDAGLSVAVPLKLNSAFVVQDTIDADFSSLDDLTDPTKEVTVSSAELRLHYTNGIPLGADATLHVLDERGTEMLTLPGDGEGLPLAPAPKATDGTSDGAKTGTAALSLSEQELRTLAEGRRLHLRLAMTQEKGGAAATLRATDTIELSLEADVEASIRIND